MYEQMFKYSGGPGIVPPLQASIPPPYETLVKTLKANGMSVSFLVIHSLKLPYFFNEL